MTAATDTPGARRSDAGEATGERLKHHLLRISQAIEHGLALASDVLTTRPRLLLASSVGGGPLSRLIGAFRREGITAQSTTLLGAQQWRRIMGRGRLGRLAARLATYVGYPAWAAVRAAISRPGVVVPVTNPFPLPFVLTLARFVHRRPVVALVWDLFPDAIEATGVGRRASIVTRLAASMNRYWFKHVHGVIFIGERMAEGAVARYGEPSAWTVIEVGCDTRELEPDALGDPAPQTDLERWCEDRTVLAYVGNMGLLHDWSTIGIAIPRLLRRLDEIETTREVGVVIAAFGPGVERLRAAWAHIDDERVRFVEPLDDHAWARLMARADIALATLRNTASGTCVPSKALSAMAASQALLAVAPADSDLADLVERHDCGAVVEPGHADDWVDAALEITGDDLLRARMQRNAFDAAKAHYDMPVIAQRWLAFLDEAGVLDG